LVSVGDGGGVDWRVLCWMSLLRSWFRVDRRRTTWRRSDRCWGACSSSPRFDEVATSLQIDDFFLPAHREIFEAMLAIDKRQQPLDVIAVADELRVRGMIARLDGGECTC
jgi:hypothetical protein